MAADPLRLDGKVRSGSIINISKDHPELVRKCGLGG